MDSRTLIEKYHGAWTHGDFTTARACLADDLDFQGSLEKHTRADAFVEALRGFHSMLRGVTLLRSFHDAQGAALLYDCETATPAGTIRTAEFFTVAAGRITAIRLVFDATALRAMMKG